MKGFFPFLYLRATRGARNPNLLVVITHASHVCGQHSFGPSITPNLIKRVLTICLVKLRQSTFDRCRPHSRTFGYY